MILRTRPLSRRTVLRGAGSRPTRAAEPAKRFVSVYTPGGTVMDRWRPTGTETAFTLGPILKPLEAHKSRLVVFQGVDMKSAQGEQHQAGILAWLTGRPQSGAHRNYVGGPSIDQVIAKRISAQKRKQSLHIAVRWATGKSHGLLSPINAAHFEDNAQWSPIPPSLDPKAIWTDLFGSALPDATGSAAARLARRKSILDHVDRQYVRVAARLGASDRAKLDQHLTKLREIEQALERDGASAQSACAAPPLVDTSDYNPRLGEAITASTDAAIPKVGKLMMDMIVMALACDITAVAALQWTDTEAKHTFPWLNLREHHHFYQHDGGFRPNECAAIGTWYCEQHAYLLSAMAKVDMGGHSLLDESVVFFGSELQAPSSHAKNDMPFLLAGGGGGLRGGRWLRYNGASHNDLLVSILNLFGDTRQSFGEARFCSGPLPNLI
jgi:hypothetical protein